MADATSGVMDKVKKGWELVKPNLVVWVVTIIIGGLMNYVLLSGNALAGHTTMIIKSRNGEKLEIGDLFRGFDRFVDYFVIGLVNIIPFAFLITPWAMFHCVDKKADFMSSLKWGLAFFLKNLVPCLISFVVCIVLIICGELCCCVGVFVAAPIALHYLYGTYAELESNTPADAKPEAPKV